MFFRARNFVGRLFITLYPRAVQMLFRQKGVYIRYSQIAVLALLMGGCSFASAHRINPLEDKYWQSESDTFLQRVSEPVHEEITQRARACAVLHTKSTNLPLTCITTGPTPTGTPRGNKHDSLIRGVWWNDDPNQWLFAQTAFWQLRNRSILALLRKSQDQIRLLREPDFNVANALSRRSVSTPMATKPIFGIWATPLRARSSAFLAEPVLHQMYS